MYFFYFTFVIARINRHNCFTSVNNLIRQLINYVLLKLPLDKLLKPVVKIFDSGTCLLLLSVRASNHDIFFPLSFRFSQSKLFCFVSGFSILFRMIKIRKKMYVYRYSSPHTRPKHLVKNYG